MRRRPGCGKTSLLRRWAHGDDRRRRLQRLLPVLPHAGRRRPVRELLATVEGDDERTAIRRQIDFRILKFNMMRRTPFDIDDYPEYRDKLLERLGRRP